LEPWSDLRKGIAGLLICILVLAAVLFIVPMSPEATPHVPSHEPISEPIRIDGDAQFTAENGIVRGNGTAENPYVIENLEISAVNGTGLIIMNTEAHVIVSNVSIHSGMWADLFMFADLVNHAGMWLHNVENVVVMNSSLTENLLGIWISESSDVTVQGNNISFNHGADSIAFTQNFEEGCAGVCIGHSSRIMLSANEFYGGSGSAIYADELKDSTIYGNEVALPTNQGFFFGYSENLTIENNTLNSLYGGGISINHCWEIAVRDNRIRITSDYGNYGLGLVSDINVTVERNIFDSAGIYLEGSSSADYSSLTIASNNLVNGKITAFHKDCSGLDLAGSSWGQVIVANCTDVRIHDLDVLDTSVGIQLVHSSNVTIGGVKMIWNKIAAVSLRQSADVTVEDSELDSGLFGIRVEAGSELKIHNNVIKNQVVGIGLWRASRFEVIDNTIVDGLWIGLDIGVADNFSVSNNDISHGRDNGVIIGSSKDFRFEDNLIAENGNGTRIFYSSNGIFSRNHFESDGLHISGNLEEMESLTISADNSVNGLPINFLKNCSDEEINGEALGQLIVANCTNVRISHLTIEDANSGIAVAYSENVSVEWNQISSHVGSSGIRSHVGMYFTGVRHLRLAHNVISNSVTGVSIDGCDGIEVWSNTLSANLVGLYSYDSGNGTIGQNTIVRNSEEGLNLVSVSNFSVFENEFSNNGIGLRIYYAVTTHIFHNNIIGNGVQALAYDNEFAWDNGYESGGNYWSDYRGVDAASGVNQTLNGGDGIGDTPYVLDWDGVDRYPLMRPYGSPPVESAPLWPLILVFAGFAWAVTILVVWQRGKNSQVHRPDKRST